MRRSRLWLPVAVVALLAIGCAGGQTAAAGPGVTPPTAAPAPLSGELTVFAAASTTDAFEAIGVAFETQHPGVTVRFNFAGSQQLAAQILGGAPADVYASADRVQMQRVVAADLTATDPSTFTGNEMTIVVEPGNPLSIDGLADLADEDLVLILAAPGVPAGGYARQVLDNAGVEAQPDSLGVNVRQVLNKVAIGEADAAIVYASDAVAAGDRVATVPIPDEVDVAATYPIAVLESAGNPEVAQAFVRFVISSEGQGILARAGFSPR